MHPRRSKVFWPCVSRGPHKQQERKRGEHRQKSWSGFWPRGGLGQISSAFVQAVPASAEAPALKQTSNNPPPKLRLPSRAPPRASARAWADPSTCGLRQSHSRILSYACENRLTHARTQDAEQGHNFIYSPSHSRHHFLLLINYPLPSPGFHLYFPGFACPLQACGPGLPSLPQLTLVIIRTYSFFPPFFLLSSAQHTPQLPPLPMPT